MNYKTLLILFLLFSAIANSKWSAPLNLQLLNSEADDFAPQWNKSENLLYFNSEKSGYSKFYTYSFDSLNKVKLVKGGINKEKNNQSFITFDYQNSTAYFSTFKQAGRKQVLNIFNSRFEKSAWNEGSLINEFSSDFFTSHPSISPNGKTIVFSTSRANKDKETDLYSAFKEQDGTWSEPQAIKELNSEGNEITPFLASDDTLYFSSDGFDGSGGYDIYYSIKVQGEWQKPTPLSEFNTENNESDFVLINPNHCIFASDKLGGKGKLDLYESKMIIEKSPINENDIKLSLESYTSVIRTSNNYSYSLNGLSQYLFFKENSADIEMPSAQINIGDFKFSIYDFNYKIGTSIIADRLKKSPDSKIKISAWTPEIIELKNDNKENSKYIADSRIKKLFEIFESYGIDKNRFEVNFNYFKPTEKEKYDYLFLSSNNNHIFDFIENKKDSITIEPVILKLIVNVNPENLLNDVAVNIKNGDKIIETNKVTKYKNEFDINLKDQVHQINELDSINVVASLKNKVSNSNFMVMHNESKSQEIVDYESNRYYVYTIMAVNQSHFINTESLNYIKEKTNDLNLDRIKIFSTFTELSKELAESLVRFLKLKSNKQIIKSDKLSDYEYINNHLFRIYIPVE
ncbi:MAG: hypothetical protein NTW25_10610 [Candidatus Kapabacteria bacterium]|nr:hypothetical protein [Candidatus Kapabacteria bacterium]